MKSLSVSFQTTTDMKHGQPLFTLLMFIGLLTITGSTLGDSQEENTRGMKLAGGDLSVATNEIERFYALGDAARNALKEGKVKEAKALATELARMTQNTGITGIMATPLRMPIKCLGRSHSPRAIWRRQKSTSWLQPTARDHRN